MPLFMTPRKTTPMSVRAIETAEAEYISGAGLRLNKNPD